MFPITRLWIFKKFCKFTESQLGLKACSKFTKYILCWDLIKTYFRYSKLDYKGLVSSMCLALYPSIKVCILLLIVGLILQCSLEEGHNYVKTVQALLLYKKTLYSPDLIQWLVWFSEFTSSVDFILNQGSSINLYMFHGGTNFGFMNGANAGPYLPTITSYG